VKLSQFDSERLQENLLSGLMIGWMRGLRKRKMLGPLGSTVLYYPNTASPPAWLNSFSPLAMIWPLLGSLGPGPRTPDSQCPPALGGGRPPVVPDRSAES
jgi:hypothetical protein